jgi:hypothetical protein
MPNGPTSLEPLETNPGDSTNEQSYSASEIIDDEESWRHAGWSSLRARIAAALERQQKSSRVRDAFASCGRCAWVFKDPRKDDTYVVRSLTCKQRWCLPCARVRAARIASTIANLLGKQPFRFITFTLKPRSEALGVTITRLFKSFVTLRQKPLWKTSQTAGAAFLELKRGANSGAWHPHLHVIAKGKFILQTQLSKEWRKITGDSYIVDIRLCRDSAKAAQYCCKYASKPFEADLIRSDADLDAAMVALHGRRMATTYGAWRGTPLEERGSEDDLIPIAPLQELIRRANDGEADARIILGRLQCNRPNTTASTHDPPEDSMERSGTRVSDSNSHPSVPAVAANCTQKSSFSERESLGVRHAYSESIPALMKPVTFSTLSDLWKF